MIVLWSSILAAVLAWFIKATVIMLICGMLPTFVAFIIDRDRERYATFCVASMNFCGVFPYLLDLWLGDHTIVAAVNSLTNVFTLFVVFGAAAFGWIMFSSVPPVISSFLSVIAQRRVTILRADQRKLIDEWGEAVAAQVEGAAKALKASATKSQSVKPTGTGGAKPKQVPTSGVTGSPSQGNAA